MDPGCVQGMAGSRAGDGAHVGSCLRLGAGSDRIAWAEDEAAVRAVWAAMDEATAAAAGARLLGRDQRSLHLSRLEFRHGCTKAGNGADDGIYR